ncbi:MAG: Crp/Fnr family transcriptional regulator [Phenylobacterium sp.]|uniref:Crp/Fnr family transcriptional regulator n=1 Tax=Phenylobacterium sp. TaxID=1871053 RepID=UPI001A47CA70|nr:Crp/Fnr family transcriptional regulator [Phenylobacterium sp.]MBL8769829.1 Crp/Fnr family transcriptional regulator [Phenylobacterium sp.]
MNDLAEFLEGARHWRVRYHARQVIFDEAEPSNAVFRIETGCVRLQIIGESGRRQILGFLFAGDIFGVCAPERITAAEAVTDVELMRYSLESVLQLSSKSRELTVELIRAANRLFNDVAHHLEHVGHMSATERVLWFLTWLAHRQGRGTGETVSLPMTLRDVGDFLALTPETLSRVLRELESDRHLSRRGRGAFAIRQPSFALRMLESGSEPMASPTASVKTVSQNKNSEELIHRQVRLDR